MTKQVRQNLNYELWVNSDEELEEGKNNKEFYLWKCDHEKAEINKLEKIKKLLGEREGGINHAEWKSEHMCLT